MAKVLFKYTHLPAASLFLGLLAVYLTYGSLSPAFCQAYRRTDDLNEAQEQTIFRSRFLASLTKEDHTSPTKRIVVVAK